MHSILLVGGGSAYRRVARGVKNGLRLRIIYRQDKTSLPNFIRAVYQLYRGIQDRPGCTVVGEVMGIYIPTGLKPEIGCEEVKGDEEDGGDEDGEEGECGEVDDEW